LVAAAGLNIQISEKDMPDKIANKEPYQQAYYPPVPTPFTRNMRTSFLWQCWRFVVINIKMLKLLARSHH
jgi:hypothetical protein